jgi:hypothetical protein
MAANERFFLVGKRVKGFERVKGYILKTFVGPACSKNPQF